MQARSALFDLYGDHLRERGGVAPVSALVRLLATLDVAAPAVRTAISRMVRQGWLNSATTERGPGYVLTARATHRLDEAAARIYRTRSAQPWDGSWALVLLPHPAERSRRERLHRVMQYLGYRELHAGAWIAPRPTPELEPTVKAEGINPQVFTVTGHQPDAELLALWQPEQLAARYREWLAEARGIVAGSGDEPDDEQAFATRSRLVHEWRKFLFADPGLPRELLPSDWPGDDAAAFFDEQAGRLAAGASRFVDACLTRRDP